MYPSLAITKPEPVAPPSASFASIETTEGSTRLAIPATEFAGRSIVEFDFTIRVEKPKSEPVDVAPKTPAVMPTTSARTKALRSEMLFPDECGAPHHGP